MLEVDFGDDNTGYIPLPDHVQVDVDRANQTLVIDLPEGLIEVYLNADEEADDGGDDRVDEAGEDEAWD